MAYFSAQNTNELSSYKKTRRKLKHVLLSQGRQSVKAEHSMIPPIGHSQIGKTRKIGQWVPRLWGKEGRHK